MPEAPNYPIQKIWTRLYNVFADDSYFQTKLLKSIQTANEGTNKYAIYTYPLTQETVVLSDSGYAMGIAYFLETTIDQVNGNDVSKMTFQIDGVFENEDFYTACLNCSNFMTDIQYTLELNKGLGGITNIRSRSVVPTEPVRNLKNFWQIMQTYNFEVRTDNIYLFN